MSSDANAANTADDQPTESDKAASPAAEEVDCAWCRGEDGSNLCERHQNEQYWAWRT